MIFLSDVRQMRRELPLPVAWLTHSYLANGQPFKLLGITYLVGKIKFKLLFQGPLAK